MQDDAIGASVSSFARTLRGVLAADAMVVPGPPPSFDRGLLVNCQFNEALGRDMPDVLVHCCRSVAAEIASRVLAMLSDSDDIAVIGVQAVIQSGESEAIRIYSVTIPLAQIASCGVSITADAIPRIAENEFSMLPHVDVILKSPEAGHG